MEGGKGLTCALFKGIGKMLCRGSIFTQKDGGTSGWFVKMIWGVGGWCVVYIGKVVESEIVVVCKKTMGDVNYKIQ